MTVGGWTLVIRGFFWICSLAKLFFLSTWATTASRPAHPLTFFTVALPTDVIGAEHGLVHYLCLSVVFTAHINSAGVRGHLLSQAF
jgi:hypothetical protein